MIAFIVLLDSETDKPSTVHEALKGEQSDQWKEATKCKYSSLIKNGTWELVPPPEGKNFVGSRWVLKVKHNEDGSMDRFKTRLVAQGYSQVEGADYEEVFSPVAHYTSVRSLLALANAHNLEIQPVHQMDVKLLFYMIHWTVKITCRNQKDLLILSDQIMFAN